MYTYIYIHIYICVYIYIYIYIYVSSCLTPHPCGQDQKDLRFIKIDLGI